MRTVDEATRVDKICGIEGFGAAITLVSASVLLGNEFSNTGSPGCDLHRIRNGGMYPQQTDLPRILKVDQSHNPLNVRMLVDSLGTALAICLFFRLHLQHSVLG